MKLANIASTRLTDEEFAFLRQLADEEERRPADVLRRLIRRAAAEASIKVKETHQAKKAEASA